MTAPFSPDPTYVSLLLEGVNDATNRFVKNPQETTRLQMVRSLAKMIASISDPVQEVYRVAGMTHLNGAIRCAMEIDLFKMVPEEGATITAMELAVNSGAERILIIRLMRVLTANGIFVEVDTEKYKHNPLSMAYTAVHVRDLVKHITDHIMPVSLQMNQYLRSINFENPADQKPSPFAYAHKTDADFFSWLKQRPQDWTIFNSGMQAVNFANPSESASAFDFDIELSGLSDSDIAVVDVAGGRGDKLIRFKEQYRQIKGRFILQDLPGVLAEVEAEIPIKGIELMEYDFFTPQPIKDAHVYHFRRILHDWSDARCREILQNTISAMDPKNSRIVIADVVLPNHHVPAELAILDMNMMAIGAMERSEMQWNVLLDSVGLRLVKVWRSKDGVQTALEARMCKDL